MVDLLLIFSIKVFQTRDDTHTNVAVNPAKRRGGMADIFRTELRGSDAVDDSPGGTRHRSVNQYAVDNLSDFRPVLTGWSFFIRVGRIKVITEGC